MTRALLILICFSTAARADDGCWRDTFRPEPVVSYLDGAHKFAVVAAPGAEAAASFLRDALRAAGAELVDEGSSGQNDGAAGPTTGDDAPLVARADPAAERVAIVRLLDNRAVGRVYDRRAALSGEFEVACGFPLPARNVHSGASSAAEVDYRRHHIGFGTVVELTWDGDGNPHQTGRWGEPHLGSDGPALDPFDFYRAVERPDLAVHYRERTRRKLAWMVPGAVALAAGVGLALAGGFAGIAQPFCLEQDHSGVCIDADHGPSGALLGVGLALTALGVAAVAIGSRIDRAPVSEAERHRLALQHNRALREKLGLPLVLDEDAPDAADHPPPLPPLPPPRKPKRDPETDRNQRLPPM
jgi:hypothetical protein